MRLSSAMKRRISGLAQTYLMMFAWDEVGGQVGSEDQDWRLLHPADSATMDRDRLLADAKKAALELAASGYEPPSPTGLLVGVYCSYIY